MVYEHELHRLAKKKVMIPKPSVRLVTGCVSLRRDGRYCSFLKGIGINECFVMHIGVIHYASFVH